MQGIPGGLGPLRQTHLTPRRNAHVRSTLAYDNGSAVVRDAQTFLRQLVYVRMRQESCGGAGHFAAGRSAVDSLVRLGFAGRIEVFHAENDESLGNMRICYDGFQDGGIDVVGPTGNRVKIDYVPIPGVHDWPMMQTAQRTRDFFVAQGVEQPLGIYGASDGFGNEEEALDPQLHPSWQINTRCSIVLQPFAWNQMRMVEDYTARYARQILRRSLASYITEVPDVLAGLPPYRNEGHVLRAFQAYVRANAGSLSAAASETVAATLAKAASGGCHLLPIYGLHANCPGDWTLNTLVRAVDALKNVAGAIDGPVILFNIRGRYDTDVESNTLCTPLLADNGPTAAAITAARDGIFVVRSPGLSTALFQQMAANATLPMVLEGANTANLCLQIGTPFLALSNNASIPTLDVERARGTTSCGRSRRSCGARRERPTRRWSSSSGPSRTPSIRTAPSIATSARCTRSSGLRRAIRSPSRSRSWNATSGWRGRCWWCRPRPCRGSGSSSRARRPLRRRLRGSSSARTARGSRAAGPAPAGSAARGSWASRAPQSRQAAVRPPSVTVSHRQGAGAGCVTRGAGGPARLAGARRRSSARTRTSSSALRRQSRRWAASASTCSARMKVSWSPRM